MSVEDRVEILLSLVRNMDVFTWSPYEVPGVDPTFIMQKLNVNPLVPPKQQRPRRATKTSYGGGEGGSGEAKAGRVY